MVKLVSRISFFRIVLVTFFICAQCTNLGAGEKGFLLVTKDYGPGLNENLRLSRLAVTPKKIKITLIVEDHPISYLYDIAKPRELIMLDTIEKTFVKLTTKAVLDQAHALREAVIKREKAVKASRTSTGSMEVTRNIVPITERPVRPLRWVDSDIPVHRWTCTKYSAYDGNETLEELFTTPWFMLGIEPKDFEIFETLKKNFAPLFKYLTVSVVPGLGSRKVWTEPNVKGFPIQLIRFMDNKPYRTMKVLKAERRLWAEGTFDCPIDYTEKK